MPSLHVVSCAYEAFSSPKLISKCPLSVVLEVGTGGGDGEGEVSVLKMSEKFNSSLYQFNENPTLCGNQI
jgi:hypothetical protein